MHPAVGWASAREASRQHKLTRSAGTTCKDPAHRCCRVEKGSWIVKQAVGQNTPVLLGKKLTTKYFTGPNYIEVCRRTNQIGSCASAALQIVCGIQSVTSTDKLIVQCPPDQLFERARKLCRLTLMWGPRLRLPLWSAWWRGQSRTWSSTWLSCSRYQQAHPENNCHASQRSSALLSQSPAAELGAAHLWVCLGVIHYSCTCGGLLGV